MPPACPGDTYARSYSVRLLIIFISPIRCDGFAVAADGRNEGFG